MDDIQLSGGPLGGTRMATDAEDGSIFAVEDPIDGHTYEYRKDGLLAIFVRQID